MTTATIDTPAFRALALEWAESNVKDAAPIFERLVAHLDNVLNIVRLEAQRDVHEQAVKVTHALMAERDMYRLRAEASSKGVMPTDLSTRLRAVAESPLTQLTSPEHAKLMDQAAQEIERYYGGMLNWKSNAQQKDRTINEQYAQLEVEKARILYLAHQNNCDLNYNGNANDKRYWVEWPHDNKRHTAVYPTPQEAIDAAMEMTADSNRSTYAYRTGQR